MRRAATSEPAALPDDTAGHHTQVQVLTTDPGATAPEPSCLHRSAAFSGALAGQIPRGFAVILGAVASQAEVGSATQPRTVGSLRAGSKRCNHDGEPIQWHHIASSSSKVAAASICAFFARYS